MMCLVAPPKIVCRNLFLVKAPLINRSQPSALAAARTASPVLRPSSSTLSSSAAMLLYHNCLRTSSADGPGGRRVGLRYAEEIAEPTCGSDGARYDIGRLLSPLQRPLNQRAAAG